MQLEDALLEVGEATSSDNLFTSVVTCLNYEGINRPGADKFRVYVRWNSGSLAWSAKDFPALEECLSQLVKWEAPTSNWIPNIDPDGENDANI